MRKRIPRLPCPIIHRRTVVTINGRPHAVVVAKDRDGFLAESAAFPDVWTHDRNPAAAVAALTPLLAQRLASGARPPQPMNPLDRRPDLRARFSQVVAQAMTRPLDFQPIFRPVPGLVEDSSLAGIVHTLAGDE
jgi:hypothetical protein